MKKTLPIFLSLCLSLSFQPNISIFANEVNNNISTTAETSTVNFGELASSAKFYKNFEKDAQLGGTTFDGTRVVDYSNELANISSLKEGSVLMKIKPDPSVSDAQILYAGDTARFIANTSSSQNPGAFRYEFKDGMLSNSNAKINNNQWYTIVYTADKVADSDSTDVRLSIDGVTDKGYTSNGNYKGFFGYGNSNTLKIGGADGLNGFKGEIAYIMITDKVLTQDEMNVLTAPEVIPTPPTFDELASSAKFYKNYKADSSLGGTKFSGTRIEDYSSELNNISSLKEGSVLMRIKPDSSVSNAQILYAGDTARFIANTSSAANPGAFRYEFAGGMLSNADKKINDNQWHTIVYTADEVPDGGSTDVRLSIDGVTDKGYTSNGKYQGFFGYGNSNTLKVGGAEGKTNFKGEIEYILITNRVLTQEQMNTLSTIAPSVSGIENMFNSNYGNTWVFTGGENAQGGFEQVQGARNYIGHFEEFIRWEKAGNSKDGPMERYTINTGKTGQNISDINANYDTIIKPYSPKAVSIFVGNEDYSKGNKGVQEFKTNLTSLINKIKADNTIPIIQTPVPDSNDSTNPKIYSDAIKEITTADPKIVLIDHYQICTEESLNFVDGKLDQQGHIKIASQFMDNTIGGFKEYELNEILDTSEKVKYLSTSPNVSVNSTSISVVIPNNDETSGITSWKYELTIGNKTIKDTVNTNFNIENLTDGASYKLVIKSSDGLKQLKTVRGNIVTNDKPVISYPWQSVETDTNAKAVTDLIADNSKSLKWLFIGDSITHGAVHTHGYNSLPQLFEKYLRDEKGRKDDVVVNTGVSGFTTKEFLERLDYCYTPYQDADVVFIMFGTNDCVSISLDEFKNNLDNIVKKIKANGSIPVLRTPNPCVDAGVRGQNIVNFVQAIEEYATANNIILINHYKQWTEAALEYPAIIKGGNFIASGDTIHPGASGQLNMLHTALQTLGLWNDTGNLENIKYEMPVYKTEHSQTTPVLNATDTTISLDTLNLALSFVTLEAKVKGSTKSIAKTTNEANITLDGLTKNTIYEVTVTGTKSDGTQITFPSQEIKTDDFLFNISQTTIIKPETSNQIVAEFLVSGVSNPDTFNFTLVDGEGSTDNTKFVIEKKSLKIKELIDVGNYSIRVKASNGTTTTERIFSISVLGKVFSDKNVIITKTGSTNNAKQLDNVSFNKIKELEEGTIIAKFKENTTSAVATIFGISDTNDKGFHLYTANGGKICYQFLGGGNDATYTDAKSNLNVSNFNTIAFKADKLNKNYKIFANGKLVATINLNNYTFIKDVPNLNIAHLGKFERPTGKNMYPFDGIIENIKISNTVLSDEELIQITSETPVIQRDDLLFYPGDATGSDYFRIPSLYTTSKGTVVASIDARFGGGADSPNNLDTTVRRSTDGGNTWDDAFLTNHFIDYPDVSGGKSGSASFIDPVMFEDETNGRLFMVVDAFPTGGGIWGECEAGSAFDNNGNLKLRFKSATTYDYIAVKKTNGTGYDVKTTSGENTEYTLNGKLEVLKNGTALTVPQADTNIQVPMNVFYANSDLRVLGTSYLYLTHSDDDGLTWSDPVILDGMTYTDTNGQKQQIKDPSMRFLGVGPGRGIQLKNGKHKGRLLFPAYQFIHNTPGSSQRSALVYSDDGGNTWARSELVDTSTLGSGAYMSEAVPVELPDGSILLLGRTNTGKIGQIVSTDGGATWQGAVTLVDEIPSNDCQISAINYSNPIDGKPAIIVSSPQHPGRRIGGVIDIGLISENGTYENGAKKYSINWKYKYDITDTTTPFKYSCLTELPNGDLMLIYESTGDSEIPFAKFSINDIIPQKIFEDSNVTITNSNSKQIATDNFNKIKSLEEGTIIINFKENSTSDVASIIGLSDNQSGSGFYIYSNGTRLGYKFINADNEISDFGTSRNLNEKAANTIAFKADKSSKGYKLFANGEVVSSKTLSEYEFLNNINGLNIGHLGKFETQNSYTFDGSIENIEIYNKPLQDSYLLELTSQTPIVTPPQRNDKIFYSGDATNSNYFRIPAILTTKAGTTIAAIDARFGGTPDSPNNLDTAVRRSTDDGATWDVATLPNHFIDYPDREGYQGKSASFIDAVMLENEDGRVFMLVDAFPAGAGLMGGHCETGSGYAPKGNGSTDPTLYLKMQWGNETNYNNRAIPNGNGTYTIYNAQGTTPTTYTMNAKFELFNNGQPLMMEQQETGKQIPMNAFYDGATFYLQKTSYLYLTYSDDQGLTWSDPIILNNMVKDDNMTFLGTGPGRGIQLKNGKHAERLLFPVYQYEYNTSLSKNAQRSALIYSDDNGVTWTRGDFVELSEGLGAMSESVPVELPDGSIILFGRTDGGKVGQAISTDGGATWTAPVTLNEISAPYSQLTAINYSQLIDGKPAIILASASHPSNRQSGVINIGLINDDNTIEWKYKAPINGEGEAYGYSCITELTNGDILVFYEGSDASTIPHKVMTIDEIKNSTGGDTEKTEIVNNNKDLDYTITKEATATESGEVSVKVINKNTKSVTIPSTVLDNKNRKYNVAILEDNAFESCSSLTDLTLPNTIKTIKNSMFLGCTNLSLLTILSETLNIADNLSNLPADTKFIVKTSAIKDALVAKGINVDNILLDDGQSEVELQKAIEEAKAVLKDDNAPVNNILKSIKNLSDAIIENNQKQ